jgi:adenylate kinase family enzyme
MDLPPLDAFGRRIMICGPSNSGKSTNSGKWTLAVALGQRLGVPAIHLDRFYHLPNTNWVKRQPDEFTRLHDEAILGDAWVIEGNDSRLFPQRLARATGIILLADNRWANYVRYVRRTLFQRDRPGGLPGAKDSLKWNMADWILVASPASLRRYQEDLPKAGRAFVEVHGMRELKKLYAAWTLQRPR